MTHRALIWNANTRKTTYSFGLEAPKHFFLTLKSTIPVVYAKDN